MKIVNNDQEYKIEPRSFSEAHLLDSINLKNCRDVTIETEQLYEPLNSFAHERDKRPTRTVIIKFTQQL